MPKLKEYHPRPNYNGWIKWQKLYSEMVLSCCDCGLAHTFLFRVIKDKLYWKARRNNKITKENRKYAPSKTNKQKD